VGPLDPWQVIEDMQDLWVRVSDLVRAAGSGPAAEDAAVIERRMADADQLLHAEIDTAQPYGDDRMVRHDLMNALGAVDNYAELIAFDEHIPEADAVREAVRRVVKAIQERPLVPKAT